MPNRVREIISACGLSALARELRHPWPTRVQGWRDRGRVPSDEIPAFIEAARKLGIPATYEDILGPEPTAEVTERTGTR